jgi:uncharacterized protein YjbI with pentapeptide repeats
MANEEQLAILKQGVKVWNTWRNEHHSVKIDLTDADLSKLFALSEGDNVDYAFYWGVNLSKADLSRANLNDADLREADLGGAILSNARLFSAMLCRTNLKGCILNNAWLHIANLSDADLREADLREADLTRSDLSGANFRGANLKKTDFRGADLTQANLSETNLKGALFSVEVLEDEYGDSATFSGTILGNSDLSEAAGLDNLYYGGPSYISIDTFARSKGKIPDVFLRGCGLSDADIEYSKLFNPELSNEEINKILYRIYDLRATQALQISPLFISYSHSNSVFVDQIGKSLTQMGIRYWRDIHDMKAGRFEKQIDRAIRQNPTVLLVLSENSLSSDWVEHEVRTARELEKEMGRDILCPVALDDSWKSSRWPKRLMEQIMEYNILDFSGWQDDVKFEGMFRKLIDGLELFYKGL